VVAQKRKKKFYFVSHYRHGRAIGKDKNTLSDFSRKIELKMFENDHLLF